MSNDDRLFAAVRDFLNSDSVPEAVRELSHLRMLFSISTEYVSHTHAQPVFSPHTIHTLHCMTHE